MRPDKFQRKVAVVILALWIASEIVAGLRTSYHPDASITGAALLVAGFLFFISPWRGENGEWEKKDDKKEESK